MLMLLIHFITSLKTDNTKRKELIFIIFSRKGSYLMEVLLSHSLYHRNIVCLYDYFNRWILFILSTENINRFVLVLTKNNHMKSS